MKTTKKALLITSLATLGITCLLLILAIFGVSVFEGLLLRVLLIVSTISVSSAITLNELNVIKRNKILGYVGLSFLILSVLFAMIIFCSPLLTLDNWFNRITAILAIVSILFIIIISVYTKLNKKMLVLQIVDYIILSLVILTLVLLIAKVNVFNIVAIPQIFGVLCVASIGLLIALTVISNKKVNDSDIIEKKPEKIKYDDLLKENQRLKEENEILKQKIIELNNVK